MQSDKHGTDLRPPLRRGLPILAVVVLLLLVLALARLLWQRGGDLRPRETAAAPTSPAAASQPSLPAVAVQPAASEPLHPLPPSDAAPLSPAELPAALESLVGSKAVTTFLQVDDFPLRLVATIDNLARTVAPSRVWPVQPTPQPFMVLSQDGRTVIDPDNALRYAPLVLLAETVNLKQLMALYQRMYPLLQERYVELGYPGRHLNDRVVAVIDHLLAAPEPGGPIEVVLPTINTPTPPPRPWVLYQFADPQLEALSAGQKIMVRIGPVNARRLKVRLAELRDMLVVAPAAAVPAAPASAAAP